MDTINNQRGESSTGGIEIPVSSGNSDRTTIPVKRKPGTPAGSKTKIRGKISGEIADSKRDRNHSPEYLETEITGNPANTTPPEAETVTVQNQTGGKKRGRKPKVKGIENAGDVSTLVLDKFEELASAILGDDGKFQPTERFFLQIGMQNTLETISAETAQKVVSIISPLSLVIGTALYGLRVSSIVLARGKEQVSPFQTESEFQPNPTPSNNESVERPYSEFRLRETLVPPITNPLKESYDNNH